MYASKKMLFENGMKIYSNIQSKQYIKKGSNECMRGYKKECWNIRQEYHKAKQNHKEFKTTDPYRILIDKSRMYEKEISIVKDTEKSVIQRLKRNNNLRIFTNISNNFLWKIKSIQVIMEE